jgi:hypothetical protein
MSREETATYTDPHPDGHSRQFSFLMDAKSVITALGYPAVLPEKGWHATRRIAWTGRGTVSHVDVSTDGGHTWHPATLPATRYASDAPREKQPTGAMPITPPDAAAVWMPASCYATMWIGHSCGAQSLPPAPSGCG